VTRGFLIFGAILAMGIYLLWIGEGGAPVMICMGLAGVAFTVSRQSLGFLPPGK
jgi:hypothetical protein